MIVCLKERDGVMRHKSIAIIMVVFLLVSFQVYGAQQLKGAFANALQSLQYYTSSIDRLIPGLRPLETAISQFQVSLAEEENVDESILFIALLYQELDNFDMAFEYYDLYQKKNPEDTWIHVLMGDLWYRIGNIDDALRCYELALDTEEYAKGYYGIGLIKASLGYEEEAIEALTQSVAIAPDFAEARLQLATLYYESALFEQALEHFETAVRFDPWLAPAHYYLSFLYEKQGELDKAQHARDMAISYDASYAELLK